MRVLLIIILIIPIVFIVAFQRNRTDNRTETLSQKEIERINLATSTDGKTLVIYKNVKISSISQGELWSKNLENGQEELLVREGMTEDYNIKNISDTTNKPIDISSISEAKFSTDNKYLYFTDSLAYVTSGAIYSINLTTKEIGFIGGSNYLDVIKKGKYKDYLILNKHKYFPAGGSYDYYYVVNPKNGEEIKPIGNSLVGLSNFSWENSLLNLSVPAKFSDLCSFMAKNCEGFNFMDGQSPNGIKNNRANTPLIVLDIKDAISGKLKVNNKEIDIIIAPYSWNQALSKNGIYIIKNTNNKLEIIARIDYGKQKPDILNIYEDSVYTISIGSDKSHRKKCTFENGVLDEGSLSCQDNTF
jgi:hypothetical protein